MYPMMGAYGLYSLGIYFLWERKKKAILLAREKQLQSEKVEAVLKTMQRITGMLAEHIATHNSEIMRWVEFRKNKGQQVSERVELPNKKIAQALHTLSEISFVLPYNENRPENIGEIEKILYEKIGGITEFQKN
jgi:response regulator RpfG family c-di-GMP phosphodiesterase